jgi:CRP-like cAMP-binding protein
VTAQEAGEPVREIATLSAGQVFGEMALLSDEPRVATVRAIDDLETYSLGKQDFREAVKLSAGFKDQIRQTYFDRYSAWRSGSA